MDERKQLLHLSLGSNLGNRKEILENALELLRQALGPMVAKSSYYVTEAWGESELNEFYNLTAAFETSIEIHSILDETQRIEKRLGRTYKSVDMNYQNRSIDIDLLFLDDLVLKSPRLTIPHSLLHLRRFVLAPLVETFPDLVHPELDKTVGDLLESLEDSLECKKLLK